MGIPMNSQKNDHVECKTYFTYQPYLELTAALVEKIVGLHFVHQSFIFSEIETQNKELDFENYIVPRFRILAILKMGSI